MTTEYILNEAMERVLELLTPSNRLVMRVMLHTGLRVGDVLALKPEQLRRRFVVTEQKTGKRKTITLTNDLLCQLRLLTGEIWVFPKRETPPSTGQGKRFGQMSSERREPVGCIRMWAPIAREKPMPWSCTGSMAT